jgi:uncharacterized phage protein (TIGR01671 family)
MRGKEREVESTCREEWEMREIKFRAWNLKKMRMEHDVYKEWGRDYLMQYTGFKDKNDKEIYEGDIVYFNDFAYDRTGGHVGDNILNGKVYFDSGMWLIETSKGHYSLCDSILNDEELEIVGNIYQNEEMLK